MLNETQLKNHYSGIGASMAAAVLGLDKYKSPLTVYKLLTDEKFREEQNKIINEKQRVQWGLRLEPVIAEQVSVLQGWKLVEVEDTQRHPDYDFLLCHPDRLIKDSMEGVEIKTRGYFGGKEYGDSGTDQILDTDMIQCQHSMMVMGYKRWYLVALLDNHELRVYPIDRNEELIAIMKNKLVKFWTENVLKRVPPDPTTINDVAMLYPNSQEKIVEVNEEILPVIDSLREIKEKQRELEREEKEYKKKIALYMKDCDRVVDHYGDTLLTYKSIERKSYQVEAGSYRTMRVI